MRQGRERVIKIYLKLRMSGSQFNAVVLLITDCFMLIQFKKTPAKGAFFELV